MNGATPPSATRSQPDASAREFAMRFTSSPRGARLARQLVSYRLNEWGHPYTSPANETVTLIAAELTANAVRHGRVPGRDFHLRLTTSPAAIRIEVSDTRTDRVPLPSAHKPPHDAESGRGLLLISRLATRWGVTARAAAPGKTIWAELIPQEEDDGITPQRSLSGDVSPSQRRTSPTIT